MFTSPEIFCAGLSLGLVFSTSSVVFSFDSLPLKIRFLVLQFLLTRYFFPCLSHLGIFSHLFDLKSYETGSEHSASRRDFHFTLFHCKVQTSGKVPVLDTGKQGEKHREARNSYEIRLAANFGHWEWERGALKNIFNLVAMVTNNESLDHSQ